MSAIISKPNFLLGHPYKPLGINPKTRRRYPKYLPQTNEEPLLPKKEQYFEVVPEKEYKEWEENKVEENKVEENDTNYKEKLVPVLKAHKESSWSTFSWLVGGVVLLVVSVVLIGLLLGTVWSRQEDEAVAEMVLKRNQSVVNMNDPTASFSALPVRSTRSLIPSRRNASNCSLTSLAA